MSLQRGSFGIEFDENTGFPYQRLWWAVLLIPLGALILVFGRGCASKPAPLPDDGSGSDVRFTAPQPAEATRRRPSLLTHYFQSRTNAESRAAVKRAEKVQAEAESAAGLASQPDPASLASLKVRSHEVKRLLSEAATCEAADDLVGTRQALRRVLVMKEAEEIRAFIERRLGAINTTLLFGDRPMPEKARHAVVAGDRISKLAKKYGCTQEFLLRANGIERPEQLRVGRDIWALAQPVFELTVLKRSGTAVLTLNGRFFKRYAVGVGKLAEAPTGTFAVQNRVREPVYVTAEHGEIPFGNPDNILGTCQLTLAPLEGSAPAPGLSLHGTWDESSLGRISGPGRLRFRNADIDELYVLLGSGTVVNVAN